MPVDVDEPAHVAQAVAQLGLKHVVITSVTRDDLPDGGASHFAQTIAAVQAACPQTTIEVLIPDLQGNEEALRKVIAAKPTVINHNIETVPRLYPQVRPMADYTRSSGAAPAGKGCRCRHSYQVRPYGWAGGIGC